MNGQLVRRCSQSSLAAITLLSVPSLVAFVVLQKYFIEGVTRSGIDG